MQPLSRAFLYIPARMSFRRTKRGPHRIGITYRKALYREYTDATFATLKLRAPEWEHPGLLGPLVGLYKVEL